MSTQDELAEGHTFRFTVSSKGVGRVVGDPTWTEANWWSEPWTIEVRAFSLDAALRKVLDAGMGAWDTGEEKPVQDATITYNPGVIGSYEAAVQRAQEGR